VTGPRTTATRWSPVLEGLDTFRTNALAGGRWSPAKGAALTTYYVRACVFAFRKVYEAWSKQYTAVRAAQTCTGLDDDPLLALPDQRAVDPCHTAVVKDTVDRVLPLLTTPELRVAVAWRGAGCTQQEAAELAGLGVKQLEGRLARVRTKVREQHSEGGAR
jgi:DNA-directed RNA polymerase specialized sigma24 family protein